MDWKVFLLRVTVALVLGALIGAERQLRQRLTGLRTNALVSTGACLFVLMTQAVPGMAATDASRIAAYVVSGIGFLGGGVIMRDGLNVRGLNTAATLWCTAAVGVLCSDCRRRPPLPKLCSIRLRTWISSSARQVMRTSKRCSASLAGSTS